MKDEQLNRNDPKNKQDDDANSTNPRKEQVTNKDEKVTNDDNKVNNTDAEDEGNKLKPGKTTDPDISPEEKKEIKTKIHTSPGNENVPE